jgi:AcrR family transcriptional regulator
MQVAGDVRERILTAALTVMRDGGIRQFTQVEVARRAGVRQSHLTYYFPTRADLVEATTMRAVDAVAASLDRATDGHGAPADGLTLTYLASTMADAEHMRMFIAMIVEADKEPALRTIVVRGTRLMEAALARALGGAGSLQHARAALAIMWGLGLYAFTIRPPAELDPTPLGLEWLQAALRRPETRVTPPAGQPALLLRTDT